MLNMGLIDNRYTVSFTIRKNAKYFSEAPFHPSTCYPEYKGAVGNNSNEVYDQFRETLKLLEMDFEHFGKETWNPFGSFIHSGDTVLIKPNFVIHENKGTGSLWSVITHPSVIRAALDYCYIAIAGRGKIIIADAPQADADFDVIKNKTCIDAIVGYYRKQYSFDIEVVDLRQLRFEYKDGVLLDNSRITLDGDPRGYTLFDLKNKSYFFDIINPEKLYGADYDRKETAKHHGNGHHEYLVANSVLKADVVFSLPKMKTHRKGGITLNFKNFIGINGNKNYLPHFRIGDVKDGGDEYLSLDTSEKLVKYSNRFLTDKLLVNSNKTKATIYRLLRTFYYKLKGNDKAKKPQVMGGGGWYGNDTLWRTILDLNRILLYGDQEGNLCLQQQRKVFSIIDGIVAGEGNGPLASDDINTGILLMGTDLFFVDIIAAHLMGVDWKKIKTYSEYSSRNHDIEMDIAKIQVAYDGIGHFDLLDDEVYYGFKEPSGWEGQYR